MAAGEKSLPELKVAIECPGLLVFTAGPKGVRELSETGATEMLKVGLRKATGL